MAKLALDDFTREQVVAEIRFDHAFMLWERAGILSTSAVRKWPALEVKEASPSKLVFVLEREYELTTALGEARVIGFRTDRTLETFRAFAAEFFELCLEKLEIPVLTRLGMRQILFLACADPAAAADAVLSAGLMRVPKGPHFGIDGRVLHPDYSIRWEADDVGATICLKAEGRTVSLTPPPAIRDIEPLKRESHGVVLDVDYFRKGPVEIGQVNLSEWITQAAHVVRRDIRRFLEEGEP